MDIKYVMFWCLVDLLMLGIVTTPWLIVLFKIMAVVGMICIMLEQYKEKHNG